MERNETQEHMENLHDMFLAFVSQKNESDEKRESVIFTYTTLRYLLQKEVFNPKMTE